APRRSDEAAASEAEPDLVAWTVPVLVLFDVAAQVILPRLAAAETAELAKAVRVGADLRAWLIAARFALSLLARQRFIPGLQRDGDRLIARWSPLVDDPVD